MTDYTISVVQDAIFLLDKLGAASTGQTLTDIVEATDLGKNKVFRLLNTLENLRMVYRDEHGKYHLGLRVFELAQNVRIHELLLHICNPVMDELLRKTEESIFLGVISDTNALCIAVRESTRSMRLFARVGIQTPLYKGGVPKVLLANMNMQKRQQLLEYFEDTVGEEDVDWDDLRHRLNRIAQEGYSITVDELDIGAHSITAPIFDAQGQVIAGMSIAGPSVRFPDATIEKYIELITDATMLISEKLGYTPVHAEDRQEIISEPI